MLMAPPLNELPIPYSRVLRLGENVDNVPVIVNPVIVNPRNVEEAHLDELFIVDLAIAVNVSLTDHLVHLLIGELLTQVGHHVPQLRAGKEIGYREMRHVCSGANWMLHPNFWSHTADGAAQLPAGHAHIAAILMVLANTPNSNTKRPP